MLDIKYIRAQPDEAKTRLEARGEDGGCIDKLIALDEQRRALVTELENLQSQRNAASKEIGALMGQGNKDEAERKKAEVREIGERIASLNKEKDNSEKALNKLSKLDKTIYQN